MGQYGFCRVLLVCRPTLDMFEWRLDLTTNMREFLDDPKIKAHSGFTQITQSITPHVDAYLLDMMDECGALEILVTGHSLGAGVGQLLSLYLAQRYPKPRTYVSAALYATPNVFNKEGVEIFSHLVNSRHVNFDMDPVTKGPCTTNVSPSGWPRCGTNYESLVFTGAGRDYYAVNAGLVEVR